MDEQQEVSQVVNSYLDSIEGDLYRPFTSKERDLIVAFRLKIHCESKAMSPREMAAFPDATFQDLLKLNPNISRRDAVRRFSCYGLDSYSFEECCYALRFAAELKALDFAHHNVPCYPTSSEFERLNKTKLYIPLLATKSPSVMQINYLFERQAWDQIIREVFNPSEMDIKRQLGVGITKRDLIEDYQNVYHYFYPDSKPNDNHCVTKEQIEQYRSETGLGLGYSPYRVLFLKLREIGIESGLNDIRRKAGLSVNNSTQSLRAKRFQEWTKENILKGFISVWELDGLDNPPPTLDRLVELSQLQAAYLKKHGNLLNASKLIPSIPETRVPHQKAIENQFACFAYFLGFIEKELSGRIDFKDQLWRVEKIALDSMNKGRDILRLPKAVQEKITEIQAKNGHRSSTPLVRLDQRKNYHTR